MGLSLGLGLTSANAGGGTPTPPFLVNTIVIEGDSITSGMPSTYSDGFYSYRYQDARPDLAIEVRAQGSRWVGTDLDDDANTLMGNVAEDMAYAPDLVTALIGANDLALRDVATYTAGLAAWYAAVKAERPECRVAWSPPLPYNPDQSHVSYADFTARRAVVMADARDPAVWSQWADYYLPLGEHPDWIADPPLSPSLWGDGVHPTGFDAINGTGGQNRLYDQFKAAVDTLADAARANATAPYESVWPVDESSLATGVVIVRRFVVSGIAHTGLASGIAVSGGDAQVRLNGAAWGTGIGRIYNGDVIDLRLTTSENPETATVIALTIGGETREIGYTTAADVAPVVYTHGGIATDTGHYSSMTFPGLTFGDGQAVVAIKSRCGGAALSTAPTLGGEALTFAGRATLPGWSVIELWTGPVAAGDYDVVVTYPTTDARHVVSYGTLTGADPVAVDVQGNAPGSESDPHLTAPVTVPANGLALAWFYEDAGDPMTPASCNAPTVQIAEGHVAYEGGTEGFVVGSLTETGQASFSAGFGNFVRLIAVWQAEGN